MQRVQDDPEFRVALIEEAVQNVIDGDLESVLGQIRDLMYAAMSFDALAAETGIRKTNLMRMLFSNGNPLSANSPATRLSAAIISTVRLRRRRRTSDACERADAAAE